METRWIYDKRKYTRDFSEEITGKNIKFVMDFWGCTRDKAIDYIKLNNIKFRG